MTLPGCHEATVNQKGTLLGCVQWLSPRAQEAAEAAVAAAAADKAEAVKACAQLELDTAELRERVARHERTQARPTHAHSGGQASLVKHSSHRVPKSY